MVLKNFVVFEGIDGSGRTTQLELLKNTPAARPFDFSAEPTQGETGKFLRRVLSGNVALDARTTAYLFAADRAEHLYAADGIMGKAERGTVCVSDRYLFSNIAYQGVTCGEELPRRLNEPFPLPELLFFFKIAPATALGRIGGRGAHEIYERLDFLRMVAERYERIIGEYAAEAEKAAGGMRVVVIDAEKSTEDVHSQIIGALRAAGKLDARNGAVP